MRILTNAKQMFSASPYKRPQNLKRTQKCNHDIFIKFLFVFETNVNIVVKIKMNQNKFTYNE